MIERQILAWLAAALTTAAVAALFVRRYAGWGRDDSLYPRLVTATILAVAICAGALAGLMVFLIVSGGG